MVACRFVVVVLAMVLLSACHTFHPVEVSEVRPGTDARVRVPTRVAVEFEAALLTDARLLTGRVLESEGGRLLLDVRVTTRSTGDRVETLRQRVRLGSTDILEVETRQLDWLRTGVMTGVGVGVVTAILLNQLSGDTGGGPDPGGGDTQESRLKLFHLGLLVH